MNLEPIKRAWSGLPVLYQVGLVVAILVAIVVIAGSASLGVSHWKDRRFDKAEAKHEAERQQLEVERDAKIQEAKAAEARAALLEETNRALEQTAKDKALSAAEQARRADEVARQTAASVAAVGELSPEDSRKDIHDRLVRLGLLKE